MPWEESFMMLVVLSLLLLLNGGTVGTKTRGWSLLEICL